MKTIKPIKFYAEKEQNARENKQQVKRMPPSGSGSGSVKGSDYGNGYGTIPSSYGGSWDVSCSLDGSQNLRTKKLMV